MKKIEKQLKQLGFYLSSKGDEKDRYLYDVRKNYSIEIHIFKNDTIEIANHYEHSRYILYRGNFIDLQWILSHLNIEECNFKQD